MPESPFAERGFTFQHILKPAYGRRLLTWMAERGLNRLELRISHGELRVPVPGYEVLCHDRAREQGDWLAELVEAGRACGVRVVPAMPHTDCHRHFVEHFPAWRAAGTVPHATGVDLNERNYCFRRPGVRDFYAALVQAVEDLCRPEELQFWLTENRLHCACEACVAAAGEDPAALTEAYFLTQAAVLRDCVETLARPVDFSLWTTQGTRHFNERLLRSLPRERVRWFYYDGERFGNYTLRPQPRTVPAEIETLAAEGYWLGAQVDWKSCGEFLTTPAIVATHCRDAAAAGLQAVCGWVEPTCFLPDPAQRRTAHPVYAYAAALLAKPGPDPEGARYGEVMEEEARAAGYGPEAAAAMARAWRRLARHGLAIRRSDTYTYWWFGTNQLGAVCRRIVRRAPVDELDQRWTEATWEETLPALAAAATALRESAGELDARAGAEPAPGDLPALAVQLRLAAAWADLCAGVLMAGVIFTRTGSWDSNPGPWFDATAEMVGSLTRATEALGTVRELYGQGAALVQESWPLKGRLPAMADQLADALAAAQAGALPAPQPESDRYPYAES